MSIKETLFKKELKKYAKQSKTGATDYFALSINKYMSILGVDGTAVGAILGYAMGGEYSAAKLTSIETIKNFDPRLGSIFIEAHSHAFSHLKDISKAENKLLVLYTKALHIIKPKSLLKELLASLANPHITETEEAVKTFAARIDRIKNNEAARIKSNIMESTPNNICSFWNSFNYCPPGNRNGGKCGLLHICMKCNSPAHSLSTCPHTKSGYVWRCRTMNERWKQTAKNKYRNQNFGGYTGSVGASYGFNPGYNYGGYGGYIYNAFPQRGRGNNNYRRNYNQRRRGGYNNNNNNNNNNNGGAGGQRPAQ